MIWLVIKLLMHYLVQCNLVRLQRDIFIVKQILIIYLFYKLLRQLNIQPLILRMILLILQQIQILTIFIYLRQEKQNNSLPYEDYFYSVLKAMTGSCREAFLDGMKPAKIVSRTAMTTRTMAAGSSSTALILSISVRE